MLGYINRTETGRRLTGPALAGGEYALADVVALGETRKRVWRVELSVFRKDILMMR